MARALIWAVRGDAHHVECKQPCHTKLGEVPLVAADNDGGDGDSDAGDDGGDDGDDDDGDEDHIDDD